MVARTRNFWLITAITLAVVLVMLRLGWWQYSKGQKRVAAAEQLASRIDEPVLSGGAAVLRVRDMDAEERQDLQGRMLRIRGTWSHKYTVFLENRQMYGKPGFYVLTPLVVEAQGYTDRTASTYAVLVQRGWVQRDFQQRDKLPELPKNAQQVVVEGVIAAPPSNLMQLGQAAPVSDFQRIRQNLNMGEYATEVGLPIEITWVLKQTLADTPVAEDNPQLDGQNAVQVEPETSSVLARDWPQIDDGASKNFGYAFQWWAMALACCALYAWLMWIRPWRTANRAVAEQ